MVRRARRLAGALPAAVRAGAEVARAHARRGGRGHADGAGRRHSRAQGPVLWRAPGQPLSCLYPHDAPAGRRPLRVLRRRRKVPGQRRGALVRRAPAVRGRHAAVDEPSRAGRRVLGDGHGHRQQPAPKPPHGARGERARLHGLPAPLTLRAQLRVARRVRAGPGGGAAALRPAAPRRLDARRLQVAQLPARRRRPPRGLPGLGVRRLVPGALGVCDGPSMVAEWVVESGGQRDGRRAIRCGNGV